MSSRITFLFFIVGIVALGSLYFLIDAAEKPNSDRNYGYSGPEQFNEFNRLIRTPPGELLPGYSAGYLQRELAKANSRSLQLRSKNEFYEWKERGPSNFPGRIRGLSIDRNDPTLNTWFAGSAGGGVWKTQDGGANWSLISEDLPNLATTVVEIAPSNSNVIYIGTGEGFFNFGSIEGDGIFKSADGGVTWKHLEQTAGPNGFRSINSIIVDPTNEDIVIACTNGFGDNLSGIYKSTDGGDTWYKVYESFDRIQQIVFEPSNFSTQYAAINKQGLIKSIDSGENWFSASDDVFADGRLQIAISPSNPEIMYVAAEGTATGNTGSDLFYSSDSGLNWQLLSEESRDQVDWLGGQGWYNNTIAVHPTDPEVVYVGGIHLHKVELGEDTSKTPPKLKTVKELGTTEFMDFVNAGLSRLRGGFATSSEWFADDPEYPIDLESDEFTSVQIRFGPGLKQNAHRFEVVPVSGTNQDGGAGVDPGDYRYVGLSEVPFEVWDVDNNRQLMVSFRDQERDGEFNLIKRDPVDAVSGREYIFVHAVDYSPENDPNISTFGGHGYKSLYAMWPTLASEATWNPDSLPESMIMISYGDFVLIDKVTTQITNGSFVHVDHHNLQFLEPEDGLFKMMLATDGGVYSTTVKQYPGESEDDWVSSSNGMINGQFYGVDKIQGREVYIGGMQDNGTNQSPLGLSASATTSYIPRNGGDGFDVAWNYDNTQKIIVSSQFNQFRSSSDGGETWNDITTTLADEGPGEAPFFSRLANHKGRPNWVYTIGISGVWKSTNFGNEWRRTDIVEEWTLGETISNNYSINLSRSNPEIVWAGGGMTSSIKVHVSVDGGDSFSSVNNYNDESLGFLTGIETHPTEDSTAYILYSLAEKPKIIRTNDLGNTWEDISGFEDNSEISKESSNGFPDVAVYSLIVLPTDTKIIWVGTEIGIFESVDKGESWHRLNSNIPAVSIWKLIAVDDQIIAATHGRGIWTVNIEGLDWPGDNRIITGIKEDIENTEITLYPNPVRDRLQMSIVSKYTGPASIIITDLNGKTILEKRMSLAEGNNSFILSVDDLNKGAYIVNLQAQGYNKSERMIKY